MDCIEEVQTMLKEIHLEELQCNPFQLFHKDWALITAGDEKEYNTMTASWGHMGIIWNKNIVTVYVRPQRYTHDFMEKFDRFTVSFYPESCREALTFCGKNSGRDTNKAKETGLTPVHEEGMTYFSQAKLVLECKKVYVDEIDPKGFLDASIDKHYPIQDYHTVYMGEVIRILEER